MVNRQNVRRRERSPRSPADHGVLSRGHRGGPVRTGGEDGGSSTRPWPWSIPKSARAAEDVEKILRQRSALLRTSGRRLDRRDRRHPRRVGRPARRRRHRLVEARETLVEELAPITTAHYSRLAGAPTDVTLDYRRSWSGRLLDALAETRSKDVERGVSLTGPHRDELELSLGGLPGRTHASQGEQRSLALALQLAAHQLATERLGTPPVLLLDDVFSELDPFRAKALLAGLPRGQALLTTALPAPVGGGRGQDLPGRGRADRCPPADGGGSGLMGADPIERDAADPRRLEDSLDAVTRQLGLQGRQGPRPPVRVLAGDRRSAAMAGHVQPIRLDSEALVVSVDHPAWATQVRGDGGRICWTGWSRRPGRPGRLGWRSGSGARRGRSHGDHRSGKAAPEARLEPWNRVTAVVDRMRPMRRRRPRCPGSRSVNRCWKGRACGAEKRGRG